MEEMSLQIPDTDRFIHVGDKVKLGRFSAETWTVGYGWYSWGGNRPVCGWFLTRTYPICKESNIKPLQLTDLIDIYMIET